MKLRTLQGRIEHIERLRGKKSRRQTFYLIHGDRRPIVAFKGFTKTIQRHDDEALERFRARALAALRDPIIMAVYADRD